MDKLEFVARQFSRAEQKPFEHYVVTRIWHLLNDLSLKIVTQQYVIRKGEKGKVSRAFTDMFFPQLGIHIEVDEPPHRSGIKEDKLREADIVNATEHDIIRIKLYKGSGEVKDIKEVNRAIDRTVQMLRHKKQMIQEFKAWDIEAEQSPRTHIEKGYIDLEGDVAFRTMADAASCFGRNYKGLQKGAVRHPKDTKILIWFPKLYKNKQWNNKISVDEKTIKEISRERKRIIPHIDRVRKKGPHLRIVFARAKDSLGDIMYRFKGKYKLDRRSTNYKTGLVWRRVETRVKTYPPTGRNSDV